jgi:Acetyltransferases
MEIRNCKIEDIKKIYNLICELEDTNFDYNDFEIAFKSKLDSKENYYILAMKNDVVMGFLSLNIDYQLHHAGKVATIEELIVTSKWRSNGIGKLLLNNAINYAKNKNCDVIELTSSFPRERAHRFYIKNGFEKGSYKFKMILDK